MIMKKLFSNTAQWFWLGLLIVVILLCNGFLLWQSDWTLEENEQDSFMAESMETIELR